MPFISIILPTYNRAHLLDSCLKAVCSQRYADWELIIVDDGSTDNSKLIIEPFTVDARINYVFQSNKGVSAARNTGIVYCKGEYFIFLDSDDIVTDNWLIQFSEALNARKTDLVFCNYYRKLPQAEPELITNTPDKHGNWGSYIPGTFLVSKELLLKAGAYDEQLKYGENTELSWRLQLLQPTLQSTAEATIIYHASDSGGRNNLQNRIDSFHYLITKHAEKFKDNPALAQTYYQVAGVDCIKCGMLKEGKDLLWKGYLQNPVNLKSLLRVLISKLPVLIHKFWN